MTYFDMLSGNDRPTTTPVVKRGIITDTRTATIAGRAQEREDWQPNRDILACMKQRHGVCG